LGRKKTNEKRNMVDTIVVKRVKRNWSSPMETKGQHKIYQKAISSIAIPENSMKPDAKPIKKIE